MAALNRRQKFADALTAAKYHQLVSPAAIPLGLFVAFVTWYFWISLSCPVGSAVPTHLCGAGRAGRLGDVNRSEKVDGRESVVVNDEKPEAVKYDDTSGPGIIESQITVFPDNEILPSNVVSREYSIGNPASSDNNQEYETAFDFPNSEASPEMTSNETSARSDCDLYHGEWRHDPVGPLYTNNSCPVLTQSQNCRGNGRPDKEYENWRWKPYQCELPRFNATQFLELMSGKTVTFVGDSVARNQMESLMCLLWQVEEPENRGTRRMQRWYFQSHSVTVIRIWSAWLVNQTTEAFSYIPEGITKIHLDTPDENVMDIAPESDVIVISNGHWFTKASAYLLRDEIVGTQSWSSPEHPPTNFTNMEAYRITTETMLTALGTSQNYSGLTILVSYSPDHYENGAWNTGGSCTGKDRPLFPGQLVEPEYTKMMYQKQLAGFDHAVKKMTNQSKLKLMDITEAFGYRHDGHPGPYRSTDPNKVTKRGLNGRPPPQDCLHWCMPGPIDTWNELMLETIRREFKTR